MHGKVDVVLTAGQAVGEARWCGAVLYFGRTVGMTTEENLKSKLSTALVVVVGWNELCEVVKVVLVVFCWAEGFWSFGGIWWAWGWGLGR
jgi:hypothetical protein